MPPGRAGSHFSIFEKVRDKILRIFKFIEVFVKS